MSVLFRLKLRIIVTATLCLLLSSCNMFNRAPPPRTDIYARETQTEIFNINANEARSLMLNTIKAEFPEVDIITLNDPPIAYRFMLKSWTARVLIFVEAEAEEGGYRFKVTNRGDGSEKATQTREHLAELLSAAAAR